MILQSFNLTRTLVNEDGNTPLLVAVERHDENRTEIIKQLIEREDIDPNRANNNGCTPLSIAIEDKKDVFLQDLLKAKGISVTRSHLKKAATHGTARACELLLDHDVSLAHWSGDIYLRANHDSALVIRKSCRGIFCLTFYTTVIFWVIVYVTLFILGVALFICSSPVLIVLALLY
eukprot:Awhi_evm1s15738